MSRFVMLEAARHAALRLDPVPRGGTAPLIVLGRSEIPLAVADHPLFLAKDGHSGRFEIVALAGLSDPRNLFWRGSGSGSGGGWAATYLPEILLSSPFRLSSESPTGLAIDRQDGRLGTTGDPLFTDAGDAAPALVRERERLQHTLADVEEGRRTAAALVAAGVMRSVSVSIMLASGSTHVLEGLYSPDTEALALLDDAAVLSAFRSGDLAAATLMSASLAQLERLRQLHNASGGTAIQDVIAG